MNYTETPLKGAWIVEPKVFKDDRGYFFESFSQKEFNSKVSDINFVQDNESYSVYGVLRGLHFQKPPYSQAKLVRVTKGEVLDVIVDIRTNSNTYLEYFSIKLSEFNHKQLFVPRGFAHAFLVLSKDAIFQYKVDNYYAADYEGGLLYNDPKLGIDWGIINKDIIINNKDLLYDSL